MSTHKDDAESTRRWRYETADSISDHDVDSSHYRKKEPYYLYIRNRVAVYGYSSSHDICGSIEKLSS